MNGILGTSASLTKDLVLLAYVFLLLPAMVVGFIFARRKMFVPYHKLTMTAITLINWVIIAFVMAVSYASSIAPYIPENLSDLRAVIATIHLTTGALAQGIATYLVILMWTERTRFERLMPAMIRIRRIKTPMRLTLALWMTTVILGIGIYFTWYVSGENSGAAVPPGATEEAVPGSTPEVGADLAVTENATEPATTEEARPTRTPRPRRTPVVTEEATAQAEATESATEDR